MLILILLLLLLLLLIIIIITSHRNTAHVECKHGVMQVIIETAGTISKSLRKTCAKFEARTTSRN